MPRTKMTRHELKEQDEITTSLQKFTDFVVLRKKEVTTALTGAAVLAIVIFGYGYYRSNRNASAQAQLSQAINTFNDTVNIKSDKERYEKTIVEAQKTHDQYRSLPIAKIALYYVALSQEGLGNTAKATQTLQQVAEVGDASIKGVAQFAMGAIYKMGTQKRQSHTNWHLCTRRTSNPIKRRTSTRSWFPNFPTRRSGKTPMML